jgi:hypothetical protein
MNLKAACKHGRWEAHNEYWGDSSAGGVFVCPGGRLLPADTLVIERDSKGRWSESVLDALDKLAHDIVGSPHTYDELREMLDAAVASRSDKETK